MYSCCKNQHWYYFIVTGILALVILSACNPPPKPKDPGLTGVYELDPVYQHFFSFLGGKEVMGEVISPMWTDGGVIRQFTENALLIYDPQGPNSQVFQLAPLGMEMDVEEPAVAPPADPQLRYVDGHIIAPMFLALYEKLGGARIVGRPLTESRYNPGEKRFEQYFENLGFYQGHDGAVDLLAYGSWSCDADCRTITPANNIVDTKPLHNSPFSGFVDTLGRDFTGPALTGPYQADDGFLEQVFSNLVLYAPPDRLDQVMIRPMIEMLRILPGPMAPAQQDGIFRFFPLAGDMGYNVPIMFTGYIDAHGGLEISGQPVQGMESLSNDMIQQCFQNLCLQLDLKTAVTRPAPLGYRYIDLYGFIDPPTFEECVSVREIALQVRSAFEQISPGQSQEISASVRENGVPLRNQELILVVTFPDGNRHSYTMPPTEQDGHTSYSLPPIPAPNGTLIPYQVCVRGLTGQTFCVDKNFVIWETP